MRDRLSAAAQKVEYQGDLSELRVTTIHGLCNHILTQLPHQTQLGNSYETLDELTQLLFIFEHFNEIIGPQRFLRPLLRKIGRRDGPPFEGVRGYFDKMTEELVDPVQLSGSPDIIPARHFPGLSRVREGPLR